MHNCEICNTITAMQTLTRKNDVVHQQAVKVVRWCRHDLSLLVRSCEMAGYDSLARDVERLAWEAEKLLDSLVKDA